MICPYICKMDCIEVLYSYSQFISTINVLLALVISAYLINRHLAYFNFPYF